MFKFLRRIKQDDDKCHNCGSDHSNPIIRRLCMKSIIDKFLDNPINRLIMERLGEV